MKRLLLGLVFTSVGLVFAPAIGCDSYDPCGDKECGDPCTICDPDDADCEETGEFKVCTSELICTSAVPAICGSR